MRGYLVIVGISLTTIMAGCKTVYNVRRVPSAELSQEGTVVFVRPTEYSVFGTNSFRDYIEITHEHASKTDASLLRVQIGFRNRGGRHPWDGKGPNFSISVKTAFYDQPYAAGSESSIPVYETNWRPLAMPRGVTVEYTATCPKPSAGYYQVRVSELLN